MFPNTFGLEQSGSRKHLLTHGLLCSRSGSLLARSALTAVNFKQVDFARLVFNQAALRANNVTSMHCTPLSPRQPKGPSDFS